ncbi:MAG: stage II sporulation protein M, partial [Micrococcales bacterium]|nr:stage II sporulation protein M [Micrococcales bacterium]
VTVAFVGLALVVGARMALDAGALESFGSAEFRQDIVDKQFAAYYSEFPHPSFAAAVWTNNALVALTCLATGITGVFPAVILAINAANVGALGGLMVSYGAGNVFFSLILPHGMLELTCVFVATAAGARLLWALLVPGARPRARALGEEGRAIAGVAAACVVGLAVSGILEGFVTPSSMAWWVKILVGGVCCAAFWLWMWVVGGRAFRAGQSTEGEVAQAVLPVAG